MDESDDDFKELCTSFFQRMKKNDTQESLGERKKLKASDSTQKRGKLKRSRKTTTKGKTLQGPVAEQLRPSSQAPRARVRGPTKLQNREPVPTVNGERLVLGPASAQPVLLDNVRSTQTEGASSNEAQPPATPSPSKPRAAELVLQRMQQFKRADPTRLQHGSAARAPKAAVAENISEDPQEEMAVGNGCGPGPPATESDAAVASALQQELGLERAGTREEDLEEKGWFFCQICQKNLSAMNVTRREQHVNRCLDEAEKALQPPAPQVPECPICGKLFLTSKSRSLHLKQCAVKMEVGPQLLLQAVRLQTAQLQKAQPEGACGPIASSLSPQVGTLKRKGVPNKKETQKRQKVRQREVLSEDMLVAMALSRSEVEQPRTVLTLKLENAFSDRIKLGAEKKSRKKRLPASLPPLLVQDTEATWRQMEDRVATLFAEEMELPSTPPLPSSRILKRESGLAGWHLPLPEGRQNFLWEGSALAGSWSPGAFYTTSLVPPIVPWQPTKSPTEEPTHSLVPREQLQPGVHACPTPHGPPYRGYSPRGQPVEPSPRKESLSASQRERQAFQDLVDLAQEGQGLSTSGLADWGREAAVDPVPSGLPLSGFVLPHEEEHLERGSSGTLSLGLLVSDFGAMVNNPHLSDVQFQVDSGEVLYAHKFVLYARCPPLIQHVNTEGFFAVEDDLQVQRVLLSDVSMEVVHTFLRYLYTADADLPSHLVPGLRSLALRFGVSALVHLCDQAPLEPDSEEKNTQSSRADNFRELLRAVWADEEASAEALLKPEDHREDREQVDDAEMDEIYEFAATQRKLLQEERVAERAVAAHQHEDRPAPGHIRASVLVHAHLEGTGYEELSKQSSDKALARQDSVGQPGLLPSGGRHPHSEVTGDQEEEKEGVEETSPRRLDSPVAQPTRGNPPRSCLRPYHTSDASPVQSLASRVLSMDSPFPVSPSKHRRDSVVPSLLTDPGHQDDRGSGSMWARRSNASLVSPDKSLSIDLTQPDSGHTCPRPSPRPLTSKRDDEVILLLDSDEELELEQGRRKPSPDSPVEERKVLEVSPQSLELFSVIDIDADLEASPSPLRQAGGQPLQCRGSMGSRGRLRLFHNGPSSPEEDSTTDSSWLVPATPLASRSRHCLSQDQTPALSTRTSGHKGDHLEPGVTAEPGEASRTTSVSPVIMPQTAPLLQLPASPGSAGRGRRASRSPSTQQPRALQGLSPGTPCPQWLGLPSAGEVVEVEDSDDELGVVPRQADSSPLPAREPPIPVDDCCWSVEPLSPIPIDHLNLERTGPLSTSSPSNGVKGPPGSPACGSPRPLHTTPIRGSQPERGVSQQQSPRASSPGSSRLSLLSSALWDNWDGEERSPESLPLTPRLRAEHTRRPSDCKTPSEYTGGRNPWGCLGSAPWGARADGKGTHRKKNLPPKVPITPMPHYSLLETPVLKKELDRFGVRPLPKRQMVLKLKEIFQYTHQTVDSDSEDEIPSSQLPSAAQDAQTSRAGGHPPPDATAGHSPQRSKGSPKIKSPQRRRKQSREIPPPLDTLPAEVGLPGPDGDTQLPASQESVATSLDSSDGSLGSQSSTFGEFGAAFESEGDDEAQEAVPASQAGQADMEAAVWRYIRSQPALYHKVLLYQPLELATLQAELREHGIRVGAGRLLDFLDAQCVTFTTAATRKEQLARRRGRPVGKKQRGQE
ncbi:structure-specific endonuclease subunit SLX4 [Rhynchocyon petersi]